MKTLLLLLLLCTGGLLRGQDALHAAPPAGFADTEPLLVLKPNQPNPFWEQTSIRFQLNKPGQVTVTLYDVLGSRVATLLKEDLEVGEHRYLFKRPADLPDGMYIYTVETGNFSRTQRMIIRK
ncbi:MAG: T9SS type A sorting domain-containing protein [Cytophagales bacterium]|nr:T9SS type A sorting domain-containing protein [Cytophagales bacterium]